MLFSIIIPVYNVGKYLDECMQSILQQVESINKNCEILLIDDGSTDNSGKLCDTYAEIYPELVSVFHKKNQGLLATRRYGFQRASGDYIINCDSDDLLEYNMLKSVKEIIEKYDSPDVILINHNDYDGINKSVGFPNIFSDKHDVPIPKEVVLREYLSGHTLVSMWGKIVKRTVLNSGRDYAEYGKLNTGEDTLQSIEIFTRGATFVYLNEALYNYRCGSGMTSNFDRNYYFTFRKIFDQIAEKKNVWNLSDFDKLLALKVLQTAGRAITQSRYNKWDSIEEHKKYLQKIYNDSMFSVSIEHLSEAKIKLQFDHYMLLQFLRRHSLLPIIIMLNLKNVLSEK